jgi:hypothetical protein
MVVFLSTLLERCSSRLSIGDDEIVTPPYIDDELFKRVKFCVNCKED